MIKECGEVSVWDLCVGSSVSGGEGDWACVGVYSYSKKVRGDPVMCLKCVFKCVFN